MKKITISHWFTLGVVALAACAGQKPPIAAMTKANMTVKRVEGTKAVEAAPLEMRLAREKLDLAQKDMDQKQYSSALRNAEEATVQAELAESKLNLKETKSKTTEAQDGLKSLESEIQHSNVSKERGF